MMLNGRFVLEEHKAKLICYRRNLEILCVAISLRGHLDLVENWRMVSLTVQYKHKEEARG